MGWIDETMPRGCEGYLQAVTTDGYEWRDIHLDRDGRDERLVNHVQVACVCGWRSPRLVAPPETTWFPSVVCLTNGFEWFDDKARELWRSSHVALASHRGLYAGVDRPWWFTNLASLPPGATVTMDGVDITAALERMRRAVAVQTLRFLDGTSDGEDEDRSARELLEAAGVPKGVIERTEAGDLEPLRVWGRSLLAGSTQGPRA